jgi:hypothetical protein
MGGLALLLIAGLSSSAQGAKAWFISTQEEDVWCGFSSEARAKLAQSDERFQGGEGVELTYHGATLDLLVESLQSEDAEAMDRYSFDGDRVTRVTREGAYIKDPLLRVTLVVDRTGKFVLTPAARLERAKRDKAGQETYWIDWPLYAALSKFPFATLIRMRPTIAVLDACQRLRWKGQRFTPVGKPH